MMMMMMMKMMMMMMMKMMMMMMMLMKMMMMMMMMMKDLAPGAATSHDADAGIASGYPAVQGSRCSPTHQRQQHPHPDHSPLMTSDIDSIAHCQSPSLSRAHSHMQPQLCLTLRLQAAFWKSTRRHIRMMYFTGHTRDILIAF